MARRPIDGVPRITQTYGVRSTLYRKGYHTGVDYSVASGTYIKSPTNGVVYRVGDGRAASDGRGFYMIIKGDDGVFHNLYHLTRWRVASGRVSEGQHVADSGNTGLSTGPHLHWETRRTNNTYDFNPADWLFAPAPTPAPAPVQGGAEVFRTLDEVARAYVFLRGKRGTDAEMRPWIGQPILRFFTVGLPEANNYRTRMATLEGQVGNLAGQIHNLTIKVNELNKRPTQAQLDELKKVADAATAQADADRQRAESLQKETEIIQGTVDKLSKEKEEAVATGNAVTRWLGDLFNKFRGDQ